MEKMFFANLLRGMKKDAKLDIAREDALNLAILHLQADAMRFINAGERDNAARMKYAISVLREEKEEVERHFCELNETIVSMEERLDPENLIID